MTQSASASRPAVHAADAETEELIRRWILRFCEAPVLIDPELMRTMLADDDEQPRSP